LTRHAPGVNIRSAGTGHWTDCDQDVVYLGTKPEKPSEVCNHTHGCATKFNVERMQYLSKCVDCGEVLGSEDTKLCDHLENYSPHSPDGLE